MLVTIGWQQYRITQHAGYNWMVAIQDHPQFWLQQDSNTIGTHTMLVTNAWQHYRPPNIPVKIGWQQQRITHHASYNWMVEVQDLPPCWLQLMVAPQDHPPCWLQLELSTIGTPTMLVTIRRQHYRNTHHSGYNQTVAVLDHPLCWLQLDGSTIRSPTMLLTIGWQHYRITQHIGYYWTVELQKKASCW